MWRGQCSLQWLASFHLARQGRSGVLDQKRTHNFDCAELHERVEAGQLQHIHERTRPQSAEQAKLRNVLGWLADALFFLAIAEKRLIDALHDNDSLRIRNRKLMHA